MRKKIIAGNWKMNYTITEADNFINEIKDRINTDEVDVVICPNNICLERVSDIIALIINVHITLSISKPSFLYSSNNKVAVHP